MTCRLQSLVHVTAKGLWFTQYFDQYTSNAFASSSSPTVSSTTSTSSSWMTTRSIRIFLSHNRKCVSAGVQLVQWIIDQSVRSVATKTFLQQIYLPNHWLHKKGCQSVCEKKQLYILSDICITWMIKEKERLKFAINSSHLK